MPYVEAFGDVVTVLLDDAMFASPGPVETSVGTTIVDVNVTTVPF